jgi:CRP/FNR family transcriptional regulator, cyclic AMP receptor protein
VDSFEGSEWQRRRPERAPRPPAATALRVYLLDADDEIAELFDLRTRLAVRQSTTVKVLEAPPGEVDLESLLRNLDSGVGLLLLDGLIARETRVGERTATELLGTGDLLQPTPEPTDALLDRFDSWKVLWPTRFGLLDTAFLERIRPWPQIFQSLLRRSVRRASDLDVMRAITCHPRLEVRLDLLFWHLATRWGRVEPTGIRLTLPLTHRLIGQLVAAERPSISHALGRLSAAGLVTGAAGDWHLVGSAEDHLDALIERTVRLTPRAPGHGDSGQLA